MVSVPALDLRVSDAERERVVAALGPHYAAGRLTLEEYGERVDEAWAARTHGELGRALRDLPAAPHPTHEEAPDRRARPGRRWPPGAPLGAPWLVLAAVAAVVLVVTSRGWLLWPLAFVALKAAKGGWGGRGGPWAWGCGARRRHA